jgi:hypothetical protein
MLIDRMKLRININAVHVYKCHAVGFTTMLCSAVRDSPWNSTGNRSINSGEGGVTQNLTFARPLVI